MTDILDRIRAHREESSKRAAELTALVNEAFESHTWVEIADALGVSKARVYQIKKGTR